ncbi:hypothetical protein F4677DRAFT_79794 [Hypoxylon crocopeplum]|nr:hypothetical protein F4677DRAFT_79794 [Hypoxylon crocopeplum]
MLVELLVLGAASLVAAAPYTKRDDLVPVNRVYISNSCNADQKKIVQQAFGEGKDLAKAFNSWNPNKDFQEVLSAYMGTDSASSYASAIKANIRNDQDIFNPTPKDQWSSLYIQCLTEKYHPTANCGNLNAIAYEYDDLGWIWNNHYITLCGGFFNDDITPQLSSLVTKAQKNQLDLHVIDDFQQNKAAVLLHESFHIEKDVSNPKVLDGPSKDGQSGTYGPKNVYELARDQGTKESYLCASAYHLSAVAIYLKQKFNLSYFPRPWEYPDHGVTVSQNKPNVEVLEMPSVADLSSGGASDVNDPNSGPDSSQWDLISGPAWAPANTVKPIPKDQVASCGNNLNANFPPGFVLLDKTAPVSEILYRMRDQACQGLCQNIQGVPGNLMTAKKQGDNGCEYAAKISAGKEAYLYATGAGQNCYDATEKSINNCMAADDNGDAIHEAGWINGPNYGEFYQVGVRDLNGNGNHHDPLTTDTTQHLGHRQVACNRPGSNPFADQYEVYISTWDDGDWGKTIQKAMGECHLSVTGWKYEDNNSHTFSDGRKNEKIAKFNTVLSNGGCIESKIEKAMGLHGGGLNCPYNRAEELNEF